LEKGGAQQQQEEANSDAKHGEHGEKGGAE
jgi:hypothetical protein